MQSNITVGIYRRLDNRLEGLDDNSPRALELHNLRKAALHEVLDKQEAITVLDWGQTDDAASHEYVELILAAAASHIVQAFVIKGVQELGKKLAEKAIDETTSGVVKWIASKFIKKQAEKKLLNFSIRLQDGTFINVDVPQATSQITIHFNNGKPETIPYTIDQQ